MRTNRLKKCPYCDGDAEHKIVEPVGRIIVVETMCKSCGAMLRTAYSPGVINKPKDSGRTALAMATKNWNRRATRKE